ncbi:MAG: motility protein A [Lachnospirales bacterium]
MELGSVIGFVAGTVFLVVSIFLNAKFDFTKVVAMIDIPSIVIVVGGTIGSTMIGYPLEKVTSALKSASKVFKPSSVDPGQAIGDIINLANLARKEGLLALEEAVESVEDEFLKKGTMLIVDGTDPELVKGILETELSYQETRHSDNRGIWEFIGEMTPAWGMIGTLIGLVMMLQDLSNPDAIGPSMAVALLTTFYGSLLANFVAIPIANKMKIFSKEEILIKEILIEGILSIQAGENPRIIEEKLKAFLAPSIRDSIGESNGGEE